MDDEINSGGKAIIIWGLAAIFVLVVGALAFGALRPQLFKMESSAVQNSPQVVKTNQDTLTELVGQYARLETEAAKYAGNDQVVSGIRAQQRQILIQMYEAKSRLPDDMVPKDARDFLSKHPQQ